MGLGCGGSFLKVMLIIFNVIFFIGGAIVLGIGIWLTVDPNTSFFKDILPSGSDPLWRASTIVLITVGAATFVVGFFGCCGACRENSCMLATYGSLLIVIFLFEIVAGILAAVFQKDLGNKLVTEMVKQIPEVKEDYAADEEAINKAWQAMQYKFKCCGAHNHTDYRNDGTLPVGVPVPTTCCVLSNKDFKDPEVDDLPACYAQALLPAGDPDSKIMHNKGCYDGLKGWLEDKSAILIGIGVGIGVLQILGIIFAFCLRKEIKNEGTMT